MSNKQEGKCTFMIHVQVKTAEGRKYTLKYQKSDDAFALIYIDTKQKRWYL